MVVHASEAGYWKRSLRAGDAAADGEKHLRLLPMPSDGLHSEGSPSTPPLAGSFEVAGRSLRFAPAVALQPGRSYLACFSPGGWSGMSGPLPRGQTGSLSASGSGILMLRYSLPLESSEPPRVISIHPTAQALPANALKFYITFSQPMEQGVFLERLSLLDAATGKEIIGPFRETELWSPDGRRLTVWIHPGRQKTGVNLNEDEGPVLAEGASVRLRISGAWRATSGQSLGRDVSRDWRVITADHTQPDPRAWKFTPPVPGSRAPLRVALDEPLDHALLESAIRLRDASGRAVEGRVEIPEGEREWRFTPALDWRATGLLLAIEPTIEDLAGNSPEKLFETDAGSQRAARQDKEILVPVR